MISFLARLDEVQEELLYYPRLLHRQRRRRQQKGLTFKFLCDVQGAVRRAILSL